MKNTNLNMRKNKKKIIVPLNSLNSELNAQYFKSHGFKEFIVCVYKQ